MRSAASVCQLRAWSLGPRGAVITRWLSKRFSCMALAPRSRPATRPMVAHHGSACHRAIRLPDRGQADTGMGTVMPAIAISEIEVAGRDRACARHQAARVRGRAGDRRGARVRRAGRPGAPSAGIGRRRARRHPARPPARGRSGRQDRAGRGAGGAAPAPGRARPDGRGAGSGARARRGARSGCMPRRPCRRSTPGSASSRSAASSRRTAFPISRCACRWRQHLGGPADDRASRGGSAAAGDPLRDLVDAASRLAGRAHRRAPLPRALLAGGARRARSG